MIVLYLLCLGPDYVLQVGGKALADPFLSPISGSDNQAEPGVGDLMAHPGPTQRQVAVPRTSTPSIQNTLGQENYMGAGDRQTQRMNKRGKWKIRGGKECEIREG